MWLLLIKMSFFKKQKRGLCCTKARNWLQWHKAEEEIANAERFIYVTEYIIFIEYREYFKKKATWGRFDNKTNFQFPIRLMSRFLSAGGSGRSWRGATLTRGPTCKVHAETLRAQEIEARPSSCEATALTILLYCSREKATPTAPRLLLLTIRQLPSAAALVPSQLRCYSETMSPLRDRISHG